MKKNADISKTSSSITSNGYKNLVSIALLIFITLLTQILTLAKSSVVAGMFGVSGDMDAYNYSLSIMTFVFGFFSAGITTIIIPYYVHDKHKKNADVFITFMLGLIISISLLVVLSREFIIELMSKREPIFVQTASNLLVILLVGQIFTSISNVTTAYFQCKEKYVTPKVIAFIVQLIVVIFLLALGNISIYQYALIVSVGMILGFLADTVSAMICGWRYKPRFCFKSQEFRRSLSTFLPIVFSTGVYQLSLFIDSSIASRLDTGKLSVLSYSNQIASMVNSIIVGNLLVYSYPKIVAKIKTNDRFSYLFGSISFFHMIVCLIICGFTTVGKEVISVLFEHGKFDSIASQSVYLCSLIYIMGQQTNIVRDLIYRYFYANGNTKDPTINGLIVNVVNIVVSVFLVQFLDVYGIVLGTVIASFVSCIVILYKFKVKYNPSISFWRKFFRIFKNILISIFTIMIVLITKCMLKIDNDLISIIVYGCETVFVFFILAYMFLRNTLKFARKL